MDGIDEQDQGVTPSGPGSQASPEAAFASSPSVSIPNAVRRTICDFATSPRDGTPFHILNTVRFNPLMERFEVLIHREEDDKRVWREAGFHCEPSVWLRRVPLPYDIPDGQWFPVMTATYLVRPKHSALRRFLARVVVRMMRWQHPKPAPITMQWREAEWCSITAELAQAIEARSAATGTGAVEDESAVGNADAPKVQP